MVNSIDFYEEMGIPKELMKDLLLASDGLGDVSAGGSGSSSELTNWDGQ